MKKKRGARDKLVKTLKRERIKKDYKLKPSFKGIIWISSILFLVFFLFLIPCVFATSSDSTSTSEWRMFQCYLNHTGYYPSDVNMHNFGLLWEYTTGGDVESSPAVADDILYIGAKDKKVYALNATNGSKIWEYTTGDYIYSSSAVVDDIVYIGDKDYKVYALNATNGSKIWEYATGSLVYSSPAVVDDIVYIGSVDTKVYALNATNGSKIWEYATGGVIAYSSPAIVDDILYIGSYDDKIHALNATNGSKIWNYTTGGDIKSSPAVANDIVYIGSDDNKVYALNATNGSKIWEYATKSDIYYPSPVITSNDIVFIGSDDNRIYALNATDGSQLWNYTTGGAIRGSVAIANGVVYVGSLVDYKVYAFTALENPTVTLTSPENSSSYIDTNNITFNCSAEDNLMLNNITLYLWNSTSEYYSNTTNLTGWSNETGWDLTNIPDNSYDWNCYACDNESHCSFADSNRTISVSLGAEAPNPPTLDSPCNKVFFKTDYVLLNYTATDPDGDNMTCYVYGSVASDNETEFIPTTLIDTTTNIVNGSYATYNWTSLGEEVYFWRVKCTDESIVALEGTYSNVCSFRVDTTLPNIVIDFPLNTSYTTAVEFVNITIKDRYKVYNITYSLDGGTNVSLDKVSGDWPVYGQNSLHTGVSLSKEAPTTNAVLWKANATGTWDIFSSPTVVDGIVYIGGKNTTGNLGWPYTSALEADTGEILWNYTTGDVDDAPTVWNGRVYVGAFDSEVKKAWCLNATTGEHIWNFSTSDKAYGSVAIENGIAYFYSYTDPNVYAVNATTGSHLWNLSLGGTAATSPTVWNDMLFVAINKAGDNLFAVNTTDNGTIWSNSDVGSAGYWDTSPTIVDGIIYIGSKDNYETLYAFNATNGSQIWNISYSTTYDHNYFSTPAVHDGVIFGGGESWYLHATNVTNGNSIWNSTSLLGDIYSSPAISNGIVYVGSHSQDVYALNESDGSIIWEKSVGGEVYSSMAVVDGIGYIGTDDWYLYAFGTEMVYEYSKNISMADGSHNITVYTTDRAGNTNSTTVYFTLDTTAPVVNLDYPENFANFSTELNFNYTASDAGFGLDTCELWGNWTTDWHLNETFISPTDSITNGSSSVTIEDGRYIWSVWCNDTLDNSVFNSTNYTLTVDTTPPGITLVSPLNNTGDSDGLVYFNYTATDTNQIDNCSLIIDEGINITNTTGEIAQNFSISLTQGSYNWSVNCTDMVNNINVTEMRVLSIVMTSDFSGDTTDLSQVNISNITNLVVEVPSDGKVNFSQDVDLSNGSDLNSYVNISYNRIDINSTAMPELDKAATLYLYNLTFTDPRVLVDGEACASSVCEEVSYSGGVFEFTVTGFTIYSAGETPTTTTTTTTPATTNIPGGTDSGAPPSPTKFSSTTGVDVGKGELVALTTARSASFTFNHIEHLVDIKEIGEDFVRIWVYSDPIEVILNVGKRANVDVDGDGFADVRIELRGITNNNAFLYFKELKGPTKTSIPKGEKVVIEEQFELPKITLLPESLALEISWMAALQNFEKFIQDKINYLIENVKTKKSWLISSVAALVTLLAFIIISFRFYLRKKLTEKQQ